MAIQSLVSDGIRPYIDAIGRNARSEWPGSASGGSRQAQRDTRRVPYTAPPGGGGYFCLGFIGSGPVVSPNPQFYDNVKPIRRSNSEF